MAKLDKVVKCMNSLLENGHPPLKLWASATGRCTSFCLKVSHGLEHLGGVHQDTFRCGVFDINHHRLSRCVNTGIVIDSSSQDGAFVVPTTGEWITFKDSKLEYRFLGGLLSTNDKKANPKRHEHKIKSSNKTMSYIRAMSQCLVEIAASAPVVSLFRSIDANGSPKYHGLLKWVITGTEAAEKYLLLVGTRTDDKKETHKREIKWGQKDASKASDKAQWDADGWKDVHRLIWEAMNKAYGYPVLKETGAPLSE
ncbi:hypothetical protein QQX98_010508 [Neonectria punicea]|uniref:Uncharacterized protein n=1 Tax=Neonectria punicea TaxID=979145 RepID=A0ABR1GP70_9HYPO